MKLPDEEEGVTVFGLQKKPSNDSDHIEMFIEQDGVGVFLTTAERKACWKETKLHVPRNADGSLSKDVALADLHCRIATVLATKLKKGQIVRCGNSKRL